jgi:hypothetical protein
LADPRGDECAGDPKDRRQYKSLRIVRPGEEKSGNDASDEAYNEDPNKSAQDVPPAQSAQLVIRTMITDRGSRTATAGQA